MKLFSRNKNKRATQEVMDRLLDRKRCSVCDAIIEKGYEHAICPVCVAEMDDRRRWWTHEKRITNDFNALSRGDEQVARHIEGLRTGTRRREE